MNVDVPIRYARRIEVACNGLPLWHGAWRSTPLWSARSPATDGRTLAMTHASARRSATPSAANAGTPTPNSTGAVAAASSSSASRSVAAGPPKPRPSCACSPVPVLQARQPHGARRPSCSDGMASFPLLRRERWLPPSSRCPLTRSLVLPVRRRLCSSSLRTPLAACAAAYSRVPALPSAPWWRPMARDFRKKVRCKKSRMM